jgi:ferredoxin--NADP+ reductase
MEADSSTAPDALRAKLYNATLTRIVRCDPALWILRVRPDRGPVPFKPGQYTTLGLGYWEPRVEGAQEETLAPGQTEKLVQRAYSFSHAVLDDDGARLLDPRTFDTHEFYVTLVLQGSPARPPALTPRLFKLGEGDRLFIGEKVTGQYTLDPVGPEDDVLFCATGTGEAPHNAMIWELLRRGHRGRIASLICVRYLADLGYRRLHERLPALYAKVRFFALTTREPQNLGRKVYIQEFIDSGALERELGWKFEPERTHVYLCGNPAMIGLPKVQEGRVVYPTPRGMFEVLESRGFTANYKKHALSRIHFEEYW